MKILSGTTVPIPRKLTMALPDDVEIDDELPDDIEVEPEENCDGSKPRLILRIKKIIRKDDGDVPRSVL